MLIERWLKQWIVFEVTHYHCFFLYKKARKSMRAFLLTNLFQKVSIMDPKKFQKLSKSFKKVSKIVKLSKTL